MNGLPIDRADITRPDELQYWRWKFCMRRLEKEADSYWIVRLTTLPNDRWFGNRPEPWNYNQLKDEIKVYVGYAHAVRFMQVPKTIWRMLPYGFSLDNPVESREGVALEECLKVELKRLSMDRRRVFNSEELIAHIKGIGAKAFKPVVVGNKEAWLGNPDIRRGIYAIGSFCASGWLGVLFESEWEGGVDVVYGSDEEGEGKGVVGRGEGVDV